MFTRKAVTGLKLLVLLFTVFICNNLLFGQYPDFQWAKRAGGTDYDYGNGIARDGANNIFITGRFSGSATFGSTTLNSKGLSDIFVAKYDDSGKLSWATQAGGTSNDYGQKVAIDNSGDVIVVGYFSDSAVFGTITLSSAGGSDIFIAKYDGSSGNVMWAKRAGGIGYDYGYDVETDGQDNILVTGSFSGSASFDNTTLTSAGGIDVFLAKYNNSGNLIWAKQGAGANSDYGYGVEPDRDNNIIITGRFYDTITFGTFTLNSSGSSDIFITKYNSSGNVVWAKKAGGISPDCGYGVTTDGSRNIIITGYFQNSAAFGSITLTSSGATDIFIAKYDASGNVIWAKKAGGASDERGYSITTDKFNNYIITGYFYNSVNFGSTTLYSAGGYDIFVAKYDDSGNLLWAKQAGGYSSDYAIGVTTDLSTNIIVVGYFYESATFGTTTIHSAGGSDIFITKMGEEITNYIEVTYPNGGEQFYVGNQYNVTWIADHYVGTVEIALSKDGGTNWINLTQYYPDNTGSYTFIPTLDYISNNCLIKVTSIENAFAKDQSNGTFSIKGEKKHYLASHIPGGVPIPTIDGYLNDSAWNYASGSELLAVGGKPDDYSVPWTDFGDNQVTWKAVWSSTTNKLYIAIQIQDDKSGIIDDDYEHMWNDDCIELYTDGDKSGGDYSNNYAIAQQWQIRKDNAKHLEFLSGLYTGPAISSAISKGANGNWILEVAMTIYNNYPSVVKQLKSNDVIGWEVWYNDSDNEHQENGTWARDHQVGWAYSGPAFYNADYFHELELGPSGPYITVMVPNGFEIWNENTKYDLKWTSQNTSGSVAIFYSLDAGTTWNSIYNSTPDDGLATWTTPDVSADITTCRIKIQDVSNSSIGDMSDNNFTIKNYPEIITVEQPNGDEQWQIGTNQMIKWSSLGAGANVRIELSRDGGINWETLFASTPNDGSESWLVTYPPSNLCLIRIMDIDGYPIDQSDNSFEILIETLPHFATIWTGYPFQPMTVYCTKALLHGDDLAAGDEIGVFDGNKCVGTKVLEQTPTQQHPVEIICSKDDGTGNGFTDGNPIIFKVWDQSAAAEYNAKSQFIDLQTGAPLNPVPFTALGTAAVQLAAPGLITQPIVLNPGWNIFSLAVTPEGSHEMTNVLSSILPVLVKVIDEQGHSIVKLFGNWVNSIGNWQATEGYYINVSQKVTLQVTGMEVTTPLAIPLKAGWNIISYPCPSAVQDAKAVVQPLIDSGYLVKVIDEKGYSIVKIFGNWNNSIGKMYPGEGYLVNVNTNCTLSVSCGNKMLAANDVISTQVLQLNHFKNSQTGNPFEPMNIFVVDARIDGKPLMIEDEIAAFDGDQCVGIGILRNPLSIEHPLEIIANKDENGNGKGFKNGDQISFKVWRNNTAEELVVQSAGIQYFNLDKAELAATSSFEALGTAVLAINLSTTSVVENIEMPMRYHLYQNHPNPFNPTTMISYDLPEATPVKLEIYDLQGNLVRCLVAEQQDAGHHAIEWNGRNSQGMPIVSGIYFYKLITDQFIATKKMIMTK